MNLCLMICVGVSPSPDVGGRPCLLVPAVQGYIYTEVLPWGCFIVAASRLPPRELWLWGGI